MQLQITDHKTAVEVMTQLKMFSKDVRDKEEFVFLRYDQCYHFL